MTQHEAYRLASSFGALQRLRGKAHNQLELHYK